MILHFSNDIERDDKLLSNIVKALKNIKNLVELTITIEYFYLIQDKKAKKLVLKTNIYK